MLYEQPQAKDSLSIIVVDDNRFSSAMLKRVLAGTTYTDIRFTNSAQEVLISIQEKPADILIADWLMPEMDGLELTKKVRALDSKNNHLTYIILITAKDGHEALSEAFKTGIDDFINKDHLHEQLLPRILAADRVSHVYRRLITQNNALSKKVQILESHNTIDQLTGLGNRRFALNKIKETISYCEHKGGMIQLLMLEIHPWEEFQKQYPPAILQTIVKELANQLKLLSRPLDILCRIGPRHFLLVTHQKSMNACFDRAFKRFKEHVTTNRIKTPVGSLSINVAMAIYAAEIPPHQMISAELLLNNCGKILDQAKTSNKVETEVLNQNEKPA